MGGGASTSHRRTPSPSAQQGDDFMSKATAQSDGSFDDGRSTAVGLVLRIANIGKRGEQAAAKVHIATLEPEVQAQGKSTQMRASVLLMNKLITDSVPKFTSYTPDDPSKEDLDRANVARHRLSDPEFYMEFYTAVYKYLYDFDCSPLQFSSKTISFRNEFLSELLRLVVFEGSHRVTFDERVRYFGLKQKSHGVGIADYGPIGEALLLGMGKVHAQPSPATWGKIYSRFLRSLVPSMIVAESSTSASPLPEGDSGGTDPVVHGDPHVSSLSASTAVPV